MHVLADPQLATVERDRRELPVGDRNALGHLLLVQRDALLVIVAANELQIHPAHDAAVVGAAAEQARRDRVRVDEHAVRIDAIDPVAGAFDELTEARLALEPATPRPAGAW